MANTIRLRRRPVNGGAGAPPSLKTTEPAYNEADDTVYLGYGDDGSGNATSIRAVAGAGTFATRVYVDAAAAAATLADGDKGDIAVAGSGANWSIKFGAVTLPKMAAIPAGTMLGNNAGAEGVPAALSAAQVKAVLALTKGDVGLGSVDNTADLDKPISTATGSALNLKAPLVSPVLSGTPTAPTAPAGTSSAQLATTAFVQAAVNAIVASADAMVYKGVIDCSGEPNYPAADAGWTYRVSVAGRIGGATGRKVEAGDIIICGQDGSASGTQAYAGSRWAIIQTNIDGALTVSNLGVTVQAHSGALDSIAGLNTAADQGLYLSGADVFDTYSLTSAGRSLGGIAGAAGTVPYFTTANVAAAFVSTLGGRNLLNNAGTANTFPFYSASNVVGLASITAAGRALLDDESVTAQRATLGLGTMATQDASAVAITGGTIDGIVLDGGTF